MISTISQAASRRSTPRTASTGLALAEVLAQRAGLEYVVLVGHGQLL